MAQGGAAESKPPRYPMETKPMKHLSTITAAALATLALSACVEQGTTRSEPTGMREASSAAESACMMAVNSKYDGKVRNLVVTSSEFSQANSQVNIRAEGVRNGPTNENWKCLVSSNGQVQELSVVGR
jgi:hypothetical protein